MLHVFSFFIPEQIKRTHINIIGISSFPNGCNHPFSRTGFCFKSKIIEGSHMVTYGEKRCFLIFRHFFSKCALRFLVFLGFPRLFRYSTYLSNSCFDKVFFLLTIKMLMAIKLIRVVTYLEEFLPINLHGKSMKWFLR